VDEDQASFKAFLGTRIPWDQSGASAMMIWHIRMAIQTAWFALEMIKIIKQIIELLEILK
jgi:hypothetical protein